MKKVVIILLCIGGIMETQALIINEIMSNPVGDDSGREWVEIYNETSTSVDISTLTVSVKGGTPIVVTPVSGGTSIPANGYAIIGSTVSGATKFLQDYPNYNGILLKSSISLVNTGATSLSIKINGATVNTVDSYTAAKEGSTLSFISGNFVAGNPTPSSENQEVVTSQTDTTSTATTTGTQATVTQMSPPTADIMLYVPQEKILVAGGESIFTVFGMTRRGDPINNLTYTWAFGDGGQGSGSSTVYRYLYPGRYIAHVEATNGYVLGTARIQIRVVSPDIAISSFGSGKYGSYIDISNPNTYDLDISQWKVSIDGGLFNFPKNTILARNETTRFSGVGMGFASTTVSSSTLIKILFPNHEEVTRYAHKDDSLPRRSYEIKTIASSRPPITSAVIPQKMLSITKQTATSSNSFQKRSQANRDTRIATFFKSIFNK